MESRYGGGYRDLLAAIVIQAIIDWKSGYESEPGDIYKPYNAERFLFYGYNGIDNWDDWDGCREICDLLGMDIAWLREKLIEEVFREYGYENS